MSRPVLHEPNDQLRIKSEPISADRIATPEMKLLIAELKETMAKENGVGIAAPQIGVHDRVIIAETDGKPVAYINPEITERSFRMIDSEEGCLSVPGCWGIVKRHRSVSVKATTETGETISLKAQGLLATIFQHEIDHLDGILFIDRAEKVEKARAL
jgi:peptide deformylase